MSVKPSSTALSTALRFESAWKTAMATSCYRYNPLLAAALAFVGGIWLAPGVHSWSFVVPGLTLLAIFGYWRYRWPLLCYLALMLLGVWRWNYTIEAPPWHITSGRALVAMQAVVIQAPLPPHWLTPGKRNEHAGCFANGFIVKTIAIRQTNGWSYGQSRCQVVILSYNYQLAPGDIIELFGWFSSLSAPTNPGEPDQRKFWRCHQVHYRMLVNHRHNLRQLGKASGFRCCRLFHRLRLAYIEILRERLGKSTGNLVAALLFGARNLLTSELVSSFRAGGIAHILAISGMHVAIIAALLYRLLIRLGLPGCACHLLTIVLLIAYAFLTDFQPPIVRALIMICAYLMAPLVGRRCQVVNTMALAALGLLLTNPRYLQQPGFVLSFIACACIIRLYLPLAPGKRPRSWWLCPGYYLREALLLSLCAWAGTAPLIAYYFQQINLGAAFATVSIMPLVSGILALALLLLFSGAGIGWGATILSYLLQMLSRWLLQTVDFWGITIAAGITVVAPWWPALVGFYLWIFCPWLGRCSRYFGGALLLVAVLGSGKLYCCQQRSLPLCVLNVGNGSVVYLNPDKEQHLLYDCGSAVPGVGRRIVVPFLLGRGITRLKAVIISHYDSDHYNGLPEVLSRIKVENIVINRQCLRSGANLLRRCRQYGVRVVVVGNGEVLPWLPQITFFYPGANLPTTGRNADNEHSLLLRWRLGKASLLLTGDLGAQALRLFLASAPEPVDLLQVPHHGSRLAGSERMLSLLRPRLAFISARKNFPAVQTVASYRRRRIQLWQTFVSGALLGRYCPQGWQLVPYRQTK